MVRNSQTKRTRTTKAARRAFALALAAGAIPAGWANAFDKTWIGSNGNWSVGSNWLPSGAPTASDNALLISPGFTVTLDSSAANPNIGSMLLGMTLNQQSGVLTTAGPILIGKGVPAPSTGTYNLLGGGLLANGLVNIGSESGGTLVLGNNATFTANGGVVVGGSQGAAMIQSGSTTFLGLQSTVTIGTDLNHPGSYTMNNGQMLVLAVSLGGTATGTGTFTQNNGLAAMGTLTFGSNSSSYLLNSGTLYANAATISTGRLALGGGTATFESLAVTGGTVNASGANVAVNSNPISLSGGTLSFTAGSLTAPGFNITGGTYTHGADALNVPSINQTGGTFDFRLSHDLRLGAGSVPTTYSLSAGQALGGNLFVGDVHAGTFIQSGGVASLSKVAIGQTGTSGTFLLSGGSITTTRTDVGIGGNGTMRVGPGGIGTFQLMTVGSGGLGLLEMNGSSITATNQGLTVGSGGTGAVSLSDGNLASNSTITFGAIGGTATLTQTGGTLRAAGQLVFGSGTNTLTQANLSGGSIEAQGQEYIGRDGAYAGFAQTGGQHSAQNLGMGYNGGTGNYVLTNGTLAVSGIANLGSNGGTAAFMQTGGYAAFQGLGLSGPSGGQGTYSLAGNGTLAVQDIFVGYYSSEPQTFLQSAGTASARSLVIPKGNYNISGGSLTITSSAIIGYGVPNAPTSAAGTFNISGNASVHQAGSEYVGQDSVGTVHQSDNSSHIIDGGLYLPAPSFPLTPGSGTYSMQGGQLSFASLALSGGGTFNQSGGEVVGVVAQTGGNYILAGGTLNSPQLDLTGGTFTGALDGTFIGNFHHIGGAINGSFVNAGSYTYSSGQFAGKLVNQGDASIEASLLAGQGVENYGSLVIATGRSIFGSTSGVINYGAMELNGGTLGGDSVVNDFGGTMTGRGTVNALFTNRGVVNPTGLLTFALPAKNDGFINAAAGQTLRFNGGIENRSSGIVQGEGLISGTFTNAGLIRANGSTALNIASLTTNSGELRIDNGSALNIPAMLNSSGVVNIRGADASLSGGTITNSGLVSGAGRINNPIRNQGTVRAENGVLTLTAVRNLNDATGQIQATTGNTVLFTLGLPFSEGFIDLSGGVFDNNNRTLANYGNILGRGTIRTGGLFNINIGTINLADGNSEIYGAVTNHGALNLTGGTFTFFNFVDNADGRIKTTAAVARYLAGASVGGTYLSDPSDNYFTDLAVTASGVLIGGVGDRFFVSGNFTNDSTQSSLWDTTLAELHFQGGGTHAMRVAGDVGQFGWGDLIIDPGNVLNVNGASATATRTTNHGAIAVSSGTTMLGEVIGNGSLIANGAGQLNATSIRQSSITFDTAARVLPNGTPAGASRIGTVAGAGTFDLSDNDLVTATPLPAVRSLIAAARHGGAWDAPGITSSSARNQSNHATTLGLLSGAEYHSLNGAAATFDGLAVADSDSLVKYTWYGDSDFNGVVNFDDYVRTDNGFNNHQSGWLNGDFDLNGTVNFDDYVLIDLAFNTQSGTLGRALAYLDGSDRSPDQMSGAALSRVVDHLAQFGESYAHNFLAAVPEPASMALLGALSCPALLRRRRSRNRR